MGQNRGQMNSIVLSKQAFVSVCTLLAQKRPVSGLETRDQLILCFQDNIIRKTLQVILLILVETSR